MDFLENEENQEKYLHAREDLLHNYADKEVDLLEKLEKCQRGKKELDERNEMVLKYARECKYLAEDLKPRGTALPEILARPFPRNEQGFNRIEYNAPDIRLPLIKSSLISQKRKFSAKSLAFY